MLIEGVVSKIGNRSVRGSTVYSLQVNNTWYGGIWNKPPACAVGDSVTFEASQNAQGYWEAKADTIKAAVQAQPPQPTQSGNTVATRSDDRQNSIVYQSSRKDAIALLEVALANDCLSLPAKKADKLEALITLTKEITDEFAFDALSPKIMSPEERLQQEVMDEVAIDE